MDMWRVAIVNFGYNHFQKLCGQQYLRHLFNWFFFVPDTRTHTLLTYFENRLAANHIM